MTNTCKYSGEFPPRLPGVVHTPASVIYFVVDLIVMLVTAQEELNTIFSRV